MLEVTFGKMSKRYNSTKRTMSDTKVESICFKENVDINSPIFLVNFDPSSYNYCSYAKNGFTRYYYIKKVVNKANNLFEVHCDLDLLATYKTCFTYALHGMCTYSTDETLWDQFFDDMRFSPSNLDTYSMSLTPDESYLYEYDNIFGNHGLPLYYPRLWDCTYDEDHNVISYGDGCFLIQTSAPKGPINYLTDKEGAEFFCNAFYNSVDRNNALQNTLIFNAMPIKLTELAESISGRSIPSTIYVGMNSVERGGGITFYEIPSTTILSFDGVIDIPHLKDAHPYFMENSRWNNMQLKTPSGVTEVNLDMCYPASNRNRGLYYSTLFDVISGTISTKYSYDSKESFTDLKGSVIYESVFSCANDIMSLVQRSRSLQEVALNAGMTGLEAAAAVYTGGASLSAGSIAAGITKAVTASNRGGASYNTGSSLASFYNTNQIGSVSLRLKPFRCRELAVSGKSFLDAYKDYCDIYGYPVNQYIDSIDNNTYYAFEKPQFFTDNAYYKANEGITNDVQLKLLKAANEGIWIE